jgi:hypothetical protein
MVFIHASPPTTAVPHELTSYHSDPFGCDPHVARDQLFYCFKAGRTNRSTRTRFTLDLSNPDKTVAPNRDAAIKKATEDMEFVDAVFASSSEVDHVEPVDCDGSVDYDEWPVVSGWIRYMDP